MQTLWMPGIVTFFGLLLALAFYGFIALVVWKFYGVFDRIGKEVAEIKAILRDDSAARRTLRE
jgi:flagellar biogenesis protein FliO